MVIQTSPTCYTLCVLFLLLGGVLAHLQAGTNHKEFTILCQLWGLAQHFSEFEPRIPLNEVDQLKLAIDVVNASVAEDGWYNNIAKNPEADATSETLKEKGDEGGRLYPEWRRAVRELQQSKEISRLVGETRAKMSASRKMAKIEEAATKIVTAIQELRIQNLLNEAKTNFEEAIQGPVATSGGKRVTYTSGRNTDCGPDSLSGKGGIAGTALRVDFFCLCAHKRSDGVANICGMDLTLAEADWNSADSAGEWGKVEKACRGRIGDAGVDYTDAPSIIRSFKKLVSYDGSTSAKNKAGLFGNLAGSTAQSTPGCNGVASDANNGGACVYYGTTADKGPNWDNIKWLTKIENGLSKITKLIHANRTVHAQLPVLKTLERRAQEIYEDAKEASEHEKSGPESTAQSQKESQKGNLTTSPDKATDRGPAVMSASTSPPFIMLWTLII